MRPRAALPQQSGWHGRCRTSSRKCQPAKINGLELGRSISFVLGGGSSDSGGSLDPAACKDRNPAPFLRTPFHEFYGQFSPDGKWIAYTSDESGREEVYIRAAFGAGAKRQISNAGGSQPRWRYDGRELFYRTGANLMASQIRVAGDEIGSDSPHVLFSHAHLGQTFYSYDVAPNGNRFLMLRPVGGSAAGALTVLSGW